MSNPITENRPSSRYGASSTRSSGGTMSGKLIVVAIVLLLIVAGIFAVRYVQARSENPVDITLVTTERIDDNLMRVWVDVSRTDTSLESYCIVTALSYNMAEVGRREILLPAGGEKQQRLGVDVPTREYAVSGGVYGCSTETAPYMDFDNPVLTF